MRKFSNYDETKTFGEGFEKIPAGAYEGVIMNAQEREVEGKNGKYTVLDIAVDITVGDYAYYYREDYKRQNDYDSGNAKWRGVIRLFVPTDDGTEEDNTRKSVFKTNIAAIEASNGGFAWDWDESKLKGLKAGIKIRDEEYDVNGHYGFSPKAFRLCDINLVREGKIKVPKPRYINGNSPKYPNDVKPSETTATTVPAAGVQAPDEVYPF